MRLHDSLDYRAREHADQDFALFGDQRLTYAQALAEANRVANALVAAGLEIGDRIAVLSKNSIEMVLLFYACSKAGVVPVPINYRLAPPEWSAIIRDAGAKLLLAQAPLAEALEPVRSDLDEVKRFISLDGSMSGYEPFAAFIADHRTDPPEREISSNEDLYQMYTSGTTGRPKGAILTQGAVCEQLHQVSMVYGISPAERALFVAPLYHAAAAVTSFAVIEMGGTLFIQEDFDPQAVVHALAQERISFALLVPAMIQFCLVSVPDVAEHSYDDLRLITYGGSPIAEEILRRAIDVLGCEFVQGYGMTETAAAITYLLPADHRRALAGMPQLLVTAGRPVMGTEVKIVDEDDTPLPNGAVGEIVVRGPQLMRGYWNLPEATERALRGGWMHTGDAGSMDDEGYIFIRDRLKDMIVSGGENVYPREVEEVLYQHPAVADAAVIGVPDERWGESVKAIIVRRPGQEVSADEILAFCAGRIGGYKRPRSVEFSEELPRNPSGKVLKNDLREPYWTGHERRIG
ncbi:MAG: long-chain-fatty-acid--CoA ligase [Planctomycetota bacterium]